MDIEYVDESSDNMPIEEIPVKPKIKRRGPSGREFSPEEIEAVRKYWELSIPKKYIGVLCELSQHFVNRIINEHCESKEIPPEQENGEGAE
jgi:hypothetical protein